VSLYLRNRKNPLPDCISGRLNLEIKRNPVVVVLGRQVVAENTHFALGRLETLQGNPIGATPLRFAAAHKAPNIAMVFRYGYTTTCSRYGKTSFFGLNTGQTPTHPTNRRCIRNAQSMDYLDS